MREALDRLRTLAARLLDRRTMERVIDPLLTDVQMECEDASRHGRAWRSRWTLLAGHVVFLKTVALCETEAVITLFCSWPGDDIAALKRTLGLSAAAIAATTVVLEMPPLVRFPVAMSDPKAVFYLIPQALVLAVPIGFTVGIFSGMRGRAASLRSRGAVLACAICVSFACLVTLAWILPWANQEFRQVVFRGTATGRGFTELTLGELSERMGSYSRIGIIDWDPRVLAYAYHQRWALSCASVILSAFALIVTQRMARRWTAGFGALGTLLTYYALLWTGRGWVVEGSAPPFLGAWLPNTLFAIACVAVIAATWRDASPPGIDIPEP
jgi:hypothetical protein